MTTGRFAVFSLGVLLAGCLATEADSVVAAPEALKCSNAPRRLISFGDSLSDVGSYRVGAVKAVGGGKFTVNSEHARVWTEVLAAKLGLPAPCAAETGLDGDPNLGFYAPVEAFPACTNYAQGGARVTHPVGPGHKLLGGESAALGQLTVPVVTQIEHYLALNEDAFAADDWVTVLAGANDVFIRLQEVGAGGDPAEAVAALVGAANELAGYVTASILAKGAKHVVVINLPDVTNTPFGLASDADTQSLIHTLVTTFNMQLAQQLAGSGAIVVDAYSFSQRLNAHPESLGLTRTSAPSCDLTPSINPLGSALVCTRSTLVDGAGRRDAFADGVHPAPYQHRLFADFVWRQLARAVPAALSGPELSAHAR